MKNTLITCYYLLLALAIGYKVADTVYKGSVTISYAQTLDVLRDEKSSLQGSVSHLTEALTQSTTVSNVLASDISRDFQPIAQHITIEPSTELAQR